MEGQLIPEFVLEVSWIACRPRKGSNLVQQQEKG